MSHAPHNWMEDDIRTQSPVATHYSSDESFQFTDTDIVEESVGQLPWHEHCNDLSTFEPNPQRCPTSKNTSGDFANAESQMSIDDWRLLERSPNYCLPDFSAKPSHFRLIHHFSSVLCHLIVFTGETENMFQTLVAPVLYGNDSPVVDAMCAFSAAHLESIGVEQKDDPVFFYNIAIKQLSEISSENGRQQEALTATILLIYYEAVSKRSISYVSILCTFDY
jgi:hypothetical protein